MRIIYRLLIYTAFALLIVAPFGASRAAQDGCIPSSGDPIRLGAIFPQGVFFSADSSDTFKGIEAMRQAINNCGGVGGRPVEWVYEPASDRESAEAAATKLISEDGVPLIVGSGLLAVNEGGRAAAESLSAVYWEVSEAVDPGGQWYFSIRPDNGQLGEAAGRFVNDILPTTLSKTTINVALIYENRPRGQTIAEGVLASLSEDPVMIYNYTDHLENSRQLGVQLREDEIDAVVLATFEHDGDHMWYAAQQADANVGAWIHVGGEGYRRGMCERVGNLDGFISIDASGPIDRASREEMIGDVYRAYREAYLAENNREPSELADLAASGVYMLLRHVLPQTGGDYAATDIREAIHSLNVQQAMGLIGEGISFGATGGRNAASSVVVQQSQNGNFCSVWPSGLASCLGGVQPFPTWRERALADENRSCNVPQV
jgi:branched-chain amino acid transport system substrate-binding protein